MPSCNKKFVAIFILAAFLAIDLSLAFFWKFDFNSDLPWYAVQILFLSQISIIAIWGLSSKQKYYVIYLTLMFGVAFLWQIEMTAFQKNKEAIKDAIANSRNLGPINILSPYVHVRVRYPLEFMDYSDGIGSVMLFVLQSAFIVLLISLYKMLRWIARYWAKDFDPEKEDCYQFCIGTLLMWIFAVALTLGTVKWLFMKYGWTFEEIQLIFSNCRDEFARIKYFAAYSLAIYWMLSFQKVKLWHLLFIIFVIQDLVLTFYHGDIYRLPLRYLDGSLFTIILLVILYPLRWCGLLGENRKEANAPRISPIDAATANSA